MEILEEFIQKKSAYIDFSEKLKQLITSILKSKDINPHQITMRVKDYESLKKKIENKDGKYKNLIEITDIIGIRIITYFEDEVDKISEIISREFEIDIENSIDKRKIDIDKFGYKSLHYVINLSKSRNKLIEYQMFKNFKAEVQIRSILQHSWAEIEHDLGYKSQSSIPDFAKRNFYRISALLEVADVEFVNLKNLLGNYKEEIKTQILSNPNSLKIDQDTLIEFINSDKEFKELQKEVSSETNKPLNDNYGKLNKVIDTLIMYKIETIEDLKNSLFKYKNEIINFEKYMNEKYISIGKASSLFSLAQLILLENKNEEFYNKNNFNEVMAFGQVLEIYNRIK